MRRLVLELADVLQHSDTRGLERDITSRVAGATFGKGADWKCSICGAPQAGPRSIQAAHIFALKEGGTTRSDGTNLIPLCHGVSVSRMLSHALKLLQARRSEKERSNAPSEEPSFQTVIEKLGLQGIDSIGCHELFDQGLITTSKIREIRADAKSWGSHESLRLQVFALPINKFEAEFDPSTNRTFKLRQAKSRLDCVKRGDLDWIKAMREVINFGRRCSAKRQFAIAQRSGAELERFLEETSGEATATINRERAVAWYELALLAMVHPENPDLSRVTALLERSCEEAKAAEDQDGYSISRIEWVHATLFAESPLSESRYNALLQIQNDCLEQLINPIQTACSRSVRAMPHIYRWRMNGLIHQAQLHLKAGKLDSATEAAKQAWGYREQLDVTTGWRAIQAIHLNGIDGAIYAWRSRYEDALRSLTRAIVRMKTAQGKRPEGFKDIAECAAWVLHKMKRHADARSVEKIARQMVDGRSGFWRPPDI